MAKKKQEIERKWLVSELPDFSGCKSARIVQGYLAVAADATEVRLRKKGSRYFETVKRGTGLRRKEREVTITRKQFDSLWPATRGRRLEKVRYTLKWKTKKVELDMYEKHLNGLVVAEIEFKSRKEAAAFSPPEWLGKEVTRDKRYKNVNLAKKKAGK
jgi:CYTH domain-containing protein